DQTFPRDSASVYARRHAQDALRRSVAALQRRGFCVRAPHAAHRTLPTQALLDSRTRHAQARIHIAAYRKAC
ncbi:hypothetical protein, partial [Xanthomonas phaseoli]|uniref:hypothetical protein n=1 Tax=Xanthomonas phaseoli TaxID=1985254 RepID=UPI001EE68394